MSNVAQPATGSVGHITWEFWARKLHSLSGIVPVGAFLLEHFWTNSYSVYGPEAFNKAVEGLRALPYVVFLEIFLIGFPLLYHSLYGILVMLQGRPNSLGYTYARNWMYTLQRVSGILLLFYIGYHVYGTRIYTAMNEIPVTFEYMADYLNNAPMFIFYTVGVLSAVFHFANGLWAFLIGWGITTTEVAMKRSAYVCIALGLLLAAVGMNSLLGFYGKAFVLNI